MARPNGLGELDGFDPNLVGQAFAETRVVLLQPSVQTYLPQPGQDRFPRVNTVLRPSSLVRAAGAMSLSVITTAFPDFAATHA